MRHLGHSVVTNTAPTPALRMRILSRSGQESRVVGLGELLTLKIEVDPTSAFGIMARNVEARTDNGEVLTLIDATGYNIRNYLNVGLVNESLIFIKGVREMGIFSHRLRWTPTVKAYRPISKLSASHRQQL